MITIQGARLRYRSMCQLALAVGLCSIAFQFLPGWEFFSFFLSVAVIGGLVGGSPGYTEQERMQLQVSFKPAFEGLLLVVMSAYAFIELMRWASLGESAVSFLNSHWPSLLLSIMCAFLGMAGLSQRSSIR